MIFEKQRGQNISDAFQLKFVVRNWSCFDKSIMQCNKALLLRQSLKLTSDKTTSCLRDMQEICAKEEIPDKKPDNLHE